MLKLRRTNRPVFAVDVGGVLASKQHDGLPVDGCKNVLRNLHEHFTLHIVSMCGKQRQADTEAWLLQWELMPLFEGRHYLRFAEGDKNRVLRAINARYFVDDRLKHVVPALDMGVKCFHMVPVATNTGIVRLGYYPVDNWLALEALILRLARCN
jgi:hypothetical protein